MLAIKYLQLRSTDTDSNAALPTATSPGRCSGGAHRGRLGRTPFAILCVLLFTPAAMGQFRSFLHEATASNTFLFGTTIDHPDLTDDPNARFAVTQVFNPQGDLSGVENNAHIGLRYASTGKWVIENQDLAALPVGSSFFVLLGSESLDGLMHELTAGNTSGGSTLIEDAAMNAVDSGSFIATWFRNPGGGSGPMYSAPLIVEYDDTEGKWRIFNVSGVDMPIGGAVSLVGILGLSSREGAGSDVGRQTIESPTITLFKHVATAGNVSGSLTRMYGNPSAFDFFFASQTVGSSIPTSPVGVLYDFFQGTWAIYNINGANMPVGAEFFVLRTGALFWDGFESGNTNKW